MQENYPTLVSVKSLKSEFEKFHKIQITSTEFTIGRSLDNNVVIAFLAISRKHCVFTKINEVDWGIEDFSSFGIEVNGTKLKKGCKFRLSDNDIIQLDATGDFVYKFVSPGEEHCTPRKRIKLEENSCSTSSCHPDIINNVKLKFEESQNFEINHIKEKIETAKQMQTTSMILKQQLELDMARRVEQLEQGFASQIENLRGEKDEVERQKHALEAERDLQLASVREQMEEKITDLMNQIQKHNETESELVKENTALKEKLLKEREDFLSELHRENSSKQDLLEQLEAKMKEQEEMRLKEKQELEVVLRNETEQLRLAKEKELSELEEQKRLREQELQQELSKMQAALHDQLSRTEAERERLQRELADKAEQVTRLNAQEQKKMELLLEERAEAEKKLQEAQVQSEKTLEELRERVSTRETELAALAAARIQQQADQSGQVISSLQQQLETVRSQLQSVEIEKNTLLQNICSSDPGEGSSKQEALEEVGELLQSELQCSICTELLVAATTLNCSHTYCKYCITVWGKKKRECPICRAPITSECRSLVLDSFIEKMVASLSAELQEKRRELLKDREAEVTALSRPAPAPTTTTVTRSRRRRRTTPTPATGATTRRTTTATVDLTLPPTPTWPLPSPARAPSEPSNPQARSPARAARSPPARRGGAGAWPACPTPTTAATGAATAAARAATGPLAVPSSLTTPGATSSSLTPTGTSSSTTPGPVTVITPYGPARVLPSSGVPTWSLTIYRPPVRTVAPSTSPVVYRPAVSRPVTPVTPVTTSTMVLRQVRVRYSGPAAPRAPQDAP